MRYWRCPKGHTFPFPVAEREQLDKSSRLLTACPGESVFTCGSPGPHVELEECPCCEKLVDRIDGLYGACAACAEEASLGNFPCDHGANAR